MIPFVINEITRATSPVKLFEYMAGDRPIVTTPLEEARAYASVRIAEGADAFAAALEAAYAGRGGTTARVVGRTGRDAKPSGGRLLGLVQSPRPAFEKAIGALRTRGGGVVDHDGGSIDTLLSAVFAPDRQTP